MNHQSEDNVIDLSGERGQRVHDVHEKRLQNVRAAFVKALPLSATAAKTKKKTKKKR